MLQARSDIMKLYKFKSENEIEPYKGGFIIATVSGEKRIFTNPTEETLKEHEYKEVVEGEKPEYDEQTQYLKTKYKDGDVITTVYEVIEIPIPTEEVITED